MGKADCFLGGENVILLCLLLIGSGYENISWGCRHALGGKSAYSLRIIISSYCNQYHGKNVDCDYLIMWKFLWCKLNIL